MRTKLFKKLFCTVSVIALLLTFVAAVPSAAAVEARTSVDWCTRISQFQQVNASLTDKRPALTMIVQNFLSADSSRWASIIANAGGMDGYFGAATKQCVEEYQDGNGLFVDGAVGVDTWYEIGSDLWDIDPFNGYIFFKRDSTYILRAKKDFPYTFYYPTFEYYDIQWNTIPKYN